jgi:hypothetical protein
VSANVYGLLVAFCAHQNISNEDAMEFALFQQLSEFDPMLNLVEASRLIIWMSP